MTDQDRKQIIAMWLLGAAAFIFFVVGMWITAPTEEDIQRCADTTNYTYEQCKHELSL